MPVPPYDRFIDPLLRYLGQHPEGVATAQAYGALADHFKLADGDRAALLPSGTQPTYQNRCGWAHDRLKRAGLSVSQRRGSWLITEKGLQFIKAHPKTVGLDDLNLTLSIVTGRVPDLTPRIKMLDAASRVPQSVKPDKPLQEAMTLMMLKNYSQLPVMTSDRTVVGMVSWRSIGSTFVRGRSGKLVRDCMEKDVLIVPEDKPLFDALSAIAETDYVLVRDSQNRISGIITHSDISDQFRSMSEPFLLLGAIENHLRRLIVAAKFTVSVLASVRDPADTNREIKDVFDLTFGEYLVLLSKEEHWKRLKINLDRKTLIQALDRVRQMRNDVMHFDPDLELEVNELRQVERFMRELFAPAKDSQNSS